MVEDDRVTSSTIQESLSHTGLNVTVTTAGTGKESIRLLSERIFDCVLLDYELPDMNAIDILQTVHANDTLFSPVIILTGNSCGKLPTNLLTLGAIDYITKSECSPGNLKRSIIYAISQRKYKSTNIVSNTSDISVRPEKVRNKTGFISSPDKITQLPSQEEFLSVIEQSIARATRHKLQISLLYIDIDNFKHINDAYGHAVGDKVLALISQRLRAAIRKNDVLCRYCEDEFALYLDHINTDIDSAITANKIMKILSVPITVENHDFHISCSIGISHQPQNDDDPKTLLSHAQTAMRMVKSNGKNSFIYYSNEMTDRAKHRIYIEHEIRKALVSNEFYMLYQPKIDINTTAMIGAEALIRWNHPVDGPISPLEFIPIAEDSDLILKIDNWVFDNVINQVRHWENCGLTVPVISINVPSREFQRNVLVDKILSVLKKHQVSGKKIELEVTERLLVESNESNHRMLSQLHDIGITISIDDFGTGYSSLSYLVQFPCDVIKIDKSFIDKTPHSHDNCMIVESIVILAHKLGKKVVAEGVETEEQYQYIKSIGCDQVQGYYFSKPLTTECFKNKISPTGRLSDTKNNTGTIHRNQTGPSH